VSNKFSTLYVIIDNDETGGVDKDCNCWGSGDDVPPPQPTKHASTVIVINFFISIKPNL
jgi:hypothetical protein